MSTTPTPTTKLEPTQFDNIQPTVSRKQLRMILICIVAIVLLPILYVVGCREVARWYQASMMDAMYRGDFPQALELCDRALKWDPTNVGITSAKSQLYINLNQSTEAAAVADQALILTRINYEGRPSPNNKESLSSALNQCAYSHALAGTKLEQSLEMINEAIGYFPTIEIGAYLDTRGYLHYLLGNDELAMEDMQRALSSEEPLYRERQTALRAQARSFVNKSRFEYMRRTDKESMAVLYHHRGLAYERVDESELATKDLERAKRMGYDPEKGVW